MTDLGVLVIQLRAAEFISLPSFTGQAVKQFFVNIIPPALLARIAEGDNYPKPYAVSPLFVENTFYLSRDKLSPDQTAWFRISGLRSDINEALETWRANRPDTVDLADGMWRVESATWQEQTTYTALIREVMTAKSRTSFRIRFISPTNFSSGRGYMPLPIPHLIIRNLAERWKSITETPLSDIPASEQLVLHSHKTETRTIQLYGRYTGFIGRARIGIERGVKDNNLMELLIRFGFYSGVGIKTTMGMGVIQPDDN